MLGLGAVATRDLEPWTVYGGLPARAIGSRSRRDVSDGPTGTTS